MAHVGGKVGSVGVAASRARHVRGCSRSTGGGGCEASAAQMRRAVPRVVRRRGTEGVQYMCMRWEQVKLHVMTVRMCCGRPLQQRAQREAMQGSAQTQLCCVRGSLLPLAGRRAAASPASPPDRSSSTCCELHYGIHHRDGHAEKDRRFLSGAPQGRARTFNTYTQRCDRSSSRPHPQLPHSTLHAHAHTARPIHPLCSPLLGDDSTGSSTAHQAARPTTFMRNATLITHRI